VEKYLTIKQAMSLLKCSRSRIYKYIQDDELVRYRIAGQAKILFREDDVKRLATPIEVEN